MQTNLEKLQTKKYLMFSIVGTYFVMLIANLSGHEITTLATNLLYVPIPGALVILSIIIARRFGIKGKHGRAWLFFVGLAVSWFIAEQIWLVYDLIYQIDPFPSLADFFYLAGYPFLFLFSICYLKPLKDAISKKTLTYVSLAAITLLVPSLYMAYDTDSEISAFEFTLALIYPIADAIVLIPALIGLILFFRGEVNFLWSLMCVAIILNVVADTGFLITSMDGSYYMGHPIDMLFLWAYILFSFGVYSHIQIFKKPNHYTKSGLEDLR
ncbi:MAG TPA: hypothetical protein VJ201_05425 [Candidatus Babeliales bacterium]|nr:hypothetical protein [Candidatus Babeliales bacterium]